MTSPEQVQEEVVDYYIEKRLKKNLDVIKHRILSKDKDYVMVVDGGEGTGKSTLAIQMGKYVDPSLNLDRITFTGEDFRKAIIGAQKGQCVIYDEAITGLSSTQSLSKINNMLKSLMMQMRQKNLLVIVVIPTIFALDRYVAIFRARVLIHTYETPKTMGMFKVYNNRYKKMLYLTAKKNYDYTKINPYFKGMFHGKFALGTASEVEYRKKKEEMMAQVQEEGGHDAGTLKFQKLLFIIRKKYKLTESETAKLLKNIEIELTNQGIGYITRKIENNFPLYSV